MALDPADLPLLSRLLDHALDLPEEQIEPWLAALPPAHAHLAPRLREMLASRLSTVGGAFLAEGPQLSTVDESVARADERVGPYRLLREIGRGGMGSVWLAERADGSYQRKVALKLPRLAWGAGLTERMARERDIGTLLEHPAIARLYDAGVDERGRPFLAFEYIDGQPIDAWCEAQGLDTRARLRLFVQVARAVAYAHGRLVVHRDLKPSNVMVTQDGQARLLDFGIAKLLTEAAPGQPGLTQEQGRVMTLHYASPEQIAGEAITVQSDVYSLGVLLYELLTGVLPHAAERSTLGAVQDAILAGDAPLASSRVKDKATARALRGEVDAILGKAMQREAGRRYATADALAEDIERHLKGETVAAQPDGAWYRLRKAVHRNRAAFAVTAVATISILTGAGIALAQARRANLEAERARVVKDFVVDAFQVNARDTPNSRELRQLPAELLLRRGAGLIDAKFAKQPELRAELFGVVANIFSKMSSNQLAAQYAQMGLDALMGIGATDDQRVPVLLILAEAQRGQGQLAAAERSARSALALSGDHPGQAIKCRLLLTEVLLNASRYSEAEKELTSVEQELTASGVKQSIDFANVMFLRAQSSNPHRRDYQPMELLGRFERAIDMAIAVEGPLSRRAVEMRLSLLQYLDEPETATSAKQHLAAALSSLRSAGGPDDLTAALAEADIQARWFDSDLVSFDEAEAAARNARDAIVRNGALAPREALAKADLALGWIYRNAGDTAQAIRFTEAAVPILLPGAESPFEKRLLTIHLGLALAGVGRHEEADRWLLDSLAWRKIDSIKSPASVSHGYAFVVWNLMMAGRTGDAEAALAKMAGLVHSSGTTNFDTFARQRFDELSVKLHLDQGHLTAALQLSGAFVLDGNESMVSELHFLRGRTLCAVGRRTEGLPEMERAIDAQIKLYFADSPDLAFKRAHAGLCALAIGDRRHAVELAGLAQSAITRQPGVSPYFKAPLIKLEAALGIKTVAAR